MGCPNKERRAEVVAAMEGKGWIVPADIGGSDHTDHSFTLRALVAAGQVEREITKRGPERACYRYRLREGWVAPPPKKRVLPRRPPADRFWEKVQFSPEANGCWLWIGAQAGAGYGLFGMIEPRLIYAHRWSYERAYGPIPAGLEIRHRCPGEPNRLCVRPDHLRSGTPQDNADDTTEANRQARGERHGRSQLQPSDVFDIFARQARGDNKAAIAAAKGITETHVNQILAGRRWRHLTQAAREDAQSRGE